MGIPWDPGNPHRVPRQEATSVFTSSMPRAVSSVGSINRQQFWVVPYKFPQWNMVESYVRINGTGMDSLFYSRKLNGMKIELHCPTLLSTYMDTFCHQTENWTNNCCFEAVHWSSRSSTILLYHRTLHINGPPKKNIVG